MTAKRFNYHHDGFGAYYLCDKEKGIYEDSIIGKIWADKLDMIDLVDLLNKLSDENDELKQFIQELATKGTGKIHLANGNIYKVNAILTDFKR